MKHQEHKRIDENQRHHQTRNENNQRSKKDVNRILEEKILELLSNLENSEIDIVVNKLRKEWLK